MRLFSFLNGTFFLFLLKFDSIFLATMYGGLSIFFFLLFFNWVTVLCHRICFHPLPLPLLLFSPEVPSPQRPTLSFPYFFVVQKSVTEGFPLFVYFPGGMGQPRKTSRIRNNVKTWNKFFLPNYYNLQKNAYFAVRVLYYLQTSHSWWFCVYEPLCCILNLKAPPVRWVRQAAFSFFSLLLFLSLTHESISHHCLREREEGKLTHPSM